MKRYFCEQISDIFYSPYSLLQGKLLGKQQNWDQALKFVNLNKDTNISNFFIKMKLVIFERRKFSNGWELCVESAVSTRFLVLHSPSGFQHILPNLFSKLIYFSFICVIYFSFIYSIIFVIIPDGHNRFIFAVKAGCHFDAMLGDKCSISLKVPSL